MNREVSNRLDALNARRERWYKLLFSKRHRKRVIRYSLLITNVVLLVVVVAFVAQKPQTNGVISPAISAKSAEETVADPLDELSSADIAVHIARAARLPEATNVTNLADSVNAQLSITSSDDVIASKPQVIDSSLPSRADIQAYVVQKGDTVASIADQFGVTSDTIRWSNNLSGDSVPVGKTLYISPVDGLLYTVRMGDSIEGIASRYQASKDKLIVINDLVEGHLPFGERIIIPGGTLPSASGRSAFNAYSSSAAGSFAFGTAPVYGYNGYDPGWCTWYAASKTGVPSNWGNANTWDDYAPSSGWTVSGVPRAGAVAQTDAGWAGHVGFVEAVSADGTMIKYSDMNGLAGFGRVGYSTWVPVHSKFETFIYR